MIISYYFDILKSKDIIRQCDEGFETPSHVALADTKIVYFLLCSVPT